MSWCAGCVVGQVMQPTLIPESVQATAVNDVGAGPPSASA